MEQLQLASRVKSKLQLLMRQIQDEQKMDSFNDLLIISRIVPKLPSECLKNMIRVLRPITDDCLTTPFTMNLSPLLHLLSTTKVQDPLLVDFLNSSGYSYCPG